MPDHRLKIVAISANYPGPDLLYGEVFVQSRLKEYVKHADVEVAGFQPALKQVRDFVAGDIRVFVTPVLADFKQRIADANPNVVVGHLISHEYFDFLLQLGKPVIVFVHGYEALSWRHRAGNYSWRSVRYLIPYVLRNTTQLRKLKLFALAARNREDVHFVFVSEWLKEAAQNDVGVVFPNAHVIPNPINTTLFHTAPKTAEQRKKIVLIRSFKARNYANDISMDAIVRLSKKEFFHDLEFSVYGEGYLFNRLTDQVRQFPNVKLYNFFLPNTAVPEVHARHGIFLCPSRLDTQGVSMCEAMSSGLIPVTSPTGGIPEYVEDGRSGFLCNGAEMIAEKIEYLYHNPAVFLNMSTSARQAILDKCSSDTIIPKELALISAVAKRSE